MTAYRIIETGSTAGVKTYAKGAPFTYLSIFKERPIRTDKGINLADNLWAIITAANLDTGTMIEIAGNRYKVKSTFEGMSGIRKVTVEKQ